MGLEAKKGHELLFAGSFHIGGGGMSQLTNSTPSRANLIYPTPSLNETQALACSLESRRPACALTPDDSGVMNNLSFSKTACPLVWVSLVGLKRRLVSLDDNVVKDQTVITHLSENHHLVCEKGK